MKFRRKKDSEEETRVDADASPSDAAWALPADAAVASGGDVARPPSDPGARDEPASPSGASAEPISAARMASPGLGLEDGPRAAAAAAAGSFASPPSPGPATGAEAGESSAPGTSAEKPELLVAGAFVGAFLFAKIIKRIGA